MISEMNIAVSKGSLFAKDGKESAPRCFLASLQVDRAAWSCARETSSSLAGRFASDVWMVDFWCRWLLQVITDDKVVLKKFPTSSISIWGRLPCWLMFFWVETSRPHVLLLMAREIFESEKRGFENCRFGSFVLWATNLIQQRIRSKASKMGP